MRRPVDLKAWFRDLINAAGGTKRAAELVGYPAPHLSEAMAAHNLERWPRLDHVAMLEAECGAPIVTAALADKAGFDLVPRQAAAPGLGALDHLRAIIKECGDVAQALAEASGSRGLSPRERKLLLDQIGEARAALDALRLDVQSEEA